MSDEAVRFLKIIIRQARRATRGLPDRGLLQICNLAPDGEKAFRHSRFGFDQTDELIAHALRRNELGRNIYIEARTVRRGAVLRVRLANALMDWRDQWHAR